MIGVRDAVKTALLQTYWSYEGKSSHQPVVGELLLSFIGETSQSIADSLYSKSQSLGVLPSSYQNLAAVFVSNTHSHNTASTSLLYVTSQKSNTTDVPAIADLLQQYLNTTRFYARSYPLSGVTEKMVRSECFFLHSNKEQRNVMFAVQADHQNNVFSIACIISNCSFLSCVSKEMIVISILHL